MKGSGKKGSGEKMKTGSENKASAQKDASSIKEKGKGAASSAVAGRKIIGKKKEEEFRRFKEMRKNWLPRNEVNGTRI